jgi:hypothetical protein
MASVCSSGALEAILRTISLIPDTGFCVVGHEFRKKTKNDARVTLS